MVLVPEDSLSSLASEVVSVKVASPSGRQKLLTSEQNALQWGEGGMWEGKWVPPSEI